jgi:hypothetical protein
MATSKNFLMINTSGHIDKQLVFKRYGDKTVITAYPNMSKVKRSDKQKRMNDMMEAANRAAHNIMHDEKLKMEAQVRLNVTSNKLYISLVREFIQLHKDDEDPLKAVGLTRNLYLRKINRNRKLRRYKK